MQIPLQITFRNLDKSDAVEQSIQEQVAALEKHFDQITRCHVIVESPHKHHHQGKLYEVRIDLKVPDDEIVVSRSHHDKQAHEDVYVALRDAFEAAGRQLKAYAQKRRGDVKSHPAPDAL